MTEKGWEYNTAKKEIILHDIKCLKLAVRMMFSGIEKRHVQKMLSLIKDTHSLKLSKNRNRPQWRFLYAMKRGENTIRLKRKANVDKDSMNMKTEL